jgi:cytochrome P450
MVFLIQIKKLIPCSMAYHEMRLILAKVFYAFDFELAPESEDWKDQNTFILWQKKPLMCKLKAVN